MMRTLQHTDGTPCPGDVCAWKGDGGHRTLGSLSDLVLRGEVGQSYTKVEERSISTYVLVERVSDTKVVLDTITTLHYGRAEYSGRPERCYISSVRPIPTEVDGVFISQRYGLYDGKTLGLGRVDDVPRFNRRTIAAAHQNALETYRDRR